MKSKLMLCLLVGTILVACAVPGWAQWPFENSFRLDNADNQYLYNCIYESDVPTLHMTLMIENPLNTTFESAGSRPVENINGFECNLTEWGNVLITGVEYPVPSINVGTLTNLVVGYSVPIPVVVDEPTVLATITFVVIPTVAADADHLHLKSATSPMPCDNYHSAFFLEPTQFPSIEGSMAYLDADDTDDPLVAAVSWMGADNPDILVAKDYVATEAQSWGAVKSLYR